MNDTHLTPQNADNADDVLQQQMHALYELERWDDVLRIGGPLLAQDNPEAWVMHLTALLKKGERDALRRDIQLALGRLPNEGRIYGLAARSRQLDGRMRDAEALIDQGLGLGVSPYMLATKCLLQEARGDLEGAMVSISSALSLEPMDTSWLVIRAKLQYNLGQRELAMATVNEALAIDPTDAQALKFKGLFLLGSERRGALDLLRTALRFDPRDTSVQRLLHAQTGLRRHGLNALAVLWVLLAAGYSWYKLQAGLRGMTATDPFTGWLPAASFLGKWLSADTLLATGTLVIGTLLLRRAQTRLMWTWLGALAFAFMLDAKSAWPTVLIQQGWAAVKAVDILGYLLGCIMLTFMMWTALAVCGLVWLGALENTLKWLAEGYRAFRDGHGPAWLLDALRRRNTWFNLTVCLPVTMLLLPGVNAAFFLLAVVFGLPVWTLLAGRLILPASRRPSLSMIFWVLSVTLAVTVLLLAPRTSDLILTSWAMPLLGGLYTLMVAQRLQDF